MSVHGQSRRSRTPPAAGVAPAEEAVQLAQPGRRRRVRTAAAVLGRACGSAWTYGGELPAENAALALTWAYPELPNLSAAECASCGGWHPVPAQVPTGDTMPVATFAM